MIHRIFTIRPPLWWMIFNPRWRRNREHLERWLHSHQMEILSLYQQETLSKLSVEHIKHALFGTTTK